MENLASKLLALVNTEKPIEFTREELECLIKVVELSAQLDLLESPPPNSNWLLMNIKQS